MVKLIFSDIDGTLLPYGAADIDGALFPLLRELRRRGVLFCPASGRQFHSLRKLFAPAAEELCFLCENGAILYGPGTEASAPVLAKTPMDRERALALAEDIADRVSPRIIVSGGNTIYLPVNSGEGFFRFLRDEKGCSLQVLDRVREIPEDILKVSVYCPEGTEEPQRILGPDWAGTFQMAAAGPDWVDFTSADKGVGARKLCAALGIPPEDAMAFGDNWNDEPMLSAVGTPWIMETADSGLLAQFPNHCSNVLDVLRTLPEE